VNKIKLSIIGIILITGGLLLAISEYWYSKQKEDAWWGYVMGPPEKLHVIVNGTAQFHCDLWKSWICQGAFHSHG
jgi:uncharacterized membrane protein